MLNSQQKHWLPGVTAAVITLAAIGLFVRTASIRRSSAIIPPQSPARKLQVENRSATYPSLSNRDIPIEQRKDLITHRIAKILENHSRFDQQHLLFALLDELQPGDFPLAMSAWLANPEYNDRSPSDSAAATAYRFLLTEWVRRAPAQALDYSMKAGGTANREIAVLELWRNLDAGGGLRWVLEAPDERSRYLSTFAPAILTDNPSRLPEILGSFSDDVQISALRRLRAALTPDSFHIVTSWIDSLADSAQRTAANRVICSQPESGILDQQTTFLLKNPEILSGIDLKSFFNFWPGSSTQAMLDFIDQIPQGDLQRKAFESALLHAASRGPTDLIDHLINKFPEGVDDSLLYSVTESSNLNIDKATGYAAQIQDSFLREKALIEILQKRMNESSDTVREWMDHHDLPDPVRRKVLGTL